MMFAATEMNRESSRSYCAAEVSLLTGKADLAPCAAGLNAQLTLVLMQPPHLEPPTSFIKHSHTRALNILTFLARRHSAAVP